MSGLTSVQQWSHDHIDRCPSCGGWELVTERELQRRHVYACAGLQVPTAGWCRHLGPYLEVAAGVAS